MLRESSKKFVLSSEQKNSHGFRVRTSGIDISQFEKNPVMLWMHQRPKGKSKDEVLPLGNFIKLEREGSKLIGVPQFDTGDQFAKQIYDKVENGTIRMASAGLLPVEFAEDENGEVWLEKSILLEATICDIGSNPDALAIALYNEQEQMITLSNEFLDKALNKNSNMVELKLNGTELGILLKLSEPTKEGVMEKVKGLIKLNGEQAGELVQLKADLETSKGSAKEYREKYEKQVKLALDKEVNNLIELAVGKGKTTMDQKPALVRLFAADHQAAKDYLEKLPENPTVAQYLSDPSKTEENPLLKLSWDQLDESGDLSELKEKHFEVFKLKFKEKFKTDYK